MLARLFITVPWSPVALELGPLHVRWYGISYAVAFLVGGWLAVGHIVRRGIPEEVGNRIVFYCIVAGLVGARLYFVVQNNPVWYLQHPQHILAFWEGGMAFFGAIFAAVATLLVMARWRHLNFWDLLDAGVLFAAIGQPIGRIGNFMNGEILGPPSSLPWAVAYTNPQSMAPQLGTPYQPANAYEGLAALCILGILLLVRQRGVRSGVLGILYMVLYPISQLIVFYWRTDSETPAIFLGLKQAQLTSLAVLALVVPVLVVAWLRTRPERTPTPPVSEPAPAG